MNIATWKELMSGGSKNTAKVIAQLMDALAPVEDDDYLNQVIQLSARQKDLKRSLMAEAITDAEARVLQNKINNAVLFTLDEIDEDSIFPLEDDAAIDTVASTSTPAEVLTNTAPSLDELKKAAKEAQRLLFSLQNEKSMTMAGKAEVIIDRQIEETESNLNLLKDKIKALTA